MTPEFASSMVLFASLLVGLTGRDNPGQPGKVCPFCQQRTETGARFCDQCGRSLSVAPDPRPTPAPTPEQPDPNCFPLQPEGSLKFRCPGGSELAIQARLDYPRLAGSDYVLLVRVNGELLLQPLVNKQNYFRCQNRQGFLYQGPQAAWKVPYAPSYCEDLAAGSPYRVVTDPGQTYRYVWKLPESPRQQVEVEITHLGKNDRGRIAAPLVVQILSEYTV